MTCFPIRALARRSLIAIAVIAAGLGAEQASLAQNTSAKAISEHRVNDMVITMADGTSLAATLVRGSSDKPMPTLLQLTRYGRFTEYNPTQADAFVAEGFNLLFVDARGSGASRGTRTIEFSEAEFADLGQVIAWIGRQNWSDGHVVTTGISYQGNTAELSTATGRRELKAAIPQYSEWDIYRGMLAPGGVRNDMMLRVWGAEVGRLDRGAACLADAAGCAGPEAGHLRPVPAPDPVSALRGALLDHQLNFNTATDLAHLTYDDDVLASGVPTRTMNVGTRLSAIAENRVPTQYWTSWLDGGKATTAFTRFMSVRAPIEIYIAPWTHGGGAMVDPLSRVAKPALLAEWRDRWKKQAGFAKDAIAGRSTERIIHYWPLGGDGWRTTRQWPVADAKTSLLYAGADGMLTLHMPAADQGVDRYKVDFTATSTVNNRWHTIVSGANEVYPDRAAENRKLLVYTAAPAAADLELIGSPLVTLYLATDRTDGAVFVYLQSVSPDGHVNYLSEGQLRLIHRKEAPPPTGTAVLGPYRSFARADARPMVPGEIVELRFALFPVAAKISKGDRLQIAIAGADADTFARYPADGDVTFTIGRNRLQPTQIALPLRPWRR
jgi:putative CocE/NonD family hydrolase